MTDETNSSESDVAELGADEVEIASVRWYRRIKDWLWGYDFFISYHWASGGPYAVDLAAQLREKGYEVFLDRAEYAMGDKWKGVGEVALRNTQRLVLVATREAVFESKPVAREVVLFTKRKRQCIPIFFDGDTFAGEEQANPGKFVVLDRLANDTLYIQDTSERLTVGPTPEVVENLAASHGIMRRRKLRTTITVTAISMLSTFLLVAVIAAIYARYQEGIAIQERDESEARRLATVSKSNADEQTDLAILLALESLNTTETDEGWEALFTALSQPVFARSPMVGHESVVTQIGFNSDGTVVASASDDGTVRLWDVASGQQIGEPFTGHGDLKDPESGSARTEVEVAAVAFSRDGRLLASGDSHGTVLLWNVESRETLAQGVLAPHLDVVNRLTFDDSGSRLLAASMDGEVRLWHVGATGAHALETVANHEAEIHSVVFRDDSGVASAGADGSVRFWNSNSRQPQDEPRSRRDEWVDKALKFNNKATLLAAANYDWTVQIWDVTTGQVVGKPLTGHDGEVLATAFSPDGARLATASLDRTVRLWDLTSEEHRQIGEPLTGHDGVVFDVAFSPGGNLLATTSHDRTVRLWDIGSGAPLGKPLTASESRPMVTLSDDGSLLACASGEGPMRLWEIADGRRAREIDVLGTGTAALDPETKDLQIATVAFSQDASRLAAGDVHGRVLLWDLTSRTRLPEPTGHTSEITALTFSHNGSTLASASFDGVVRLWSVKSGREVGSPASGHSGSVSGLAFSSDGSRLVSASFDKQLRVWDANSGRQVGQTLSGHTEVVWHAAFYRTDSQVVSAAGDGTVRLWDVATGKQVGKPLLSSHAEWVETAGFSRNGSHLVTATRDGALQLWDVASGQKIGVPLAGHDAVVTGMALSRDAGLVASGGDYGTVRLWPSQDNWRELACEAVDRNLSLAEWREFVDPDKPYRRQCDRFPAGLGAPAE